MFLTKDEIKELTQRVQHSAQAKALNHMGIVHKIRADGSVLVLRAHVENVLGGTGVAKLKEKTFEPNWAAINS